MGWKWDEGLQAPTDPPFSPLQWQAISLTVIEKVQIAAAILGSLFLIASISWLIWSTFSPSAKWQRQDLLFQICYGMYGFMDVVCIGESLGCVDSWTWCAKVGLWDVWIHGHGVPRWVSGMCGSMDVVCIGGSLGCVDPWTWCA